MSNPTTPFSWQMPTNTDLVTDLPADFEVFGQAVATSMQDLLGGTTGQVLAKASNADMDFVWSADAAGMTNPMTTTGDVIYSSPGSTPNRLGIGSTGNVLTVAGGVPTWAAPAGGGGLTLLSTTSLTGNSVTISSISGSYKNLYVIARNISTTSNENIMFRFNSDTGSNYSQGRVRISGSAAAFYNIAAATAIEMLETYTTNTFNTQGFVELNIPRYTESEIKAYYYRSIGSGSTAQKCDMGEGSYNSTSAISSITVFCQGGGTTFSTGTIYVYGVS